MSSSASDAEVIGASLTRPDQFAVIFDRHFSLIHGYLWRRGGREAADELAAEVFLVAFDLRARYDESYLDAKPWLFGIATNLFRNHRRKEQRRLKAYANSGIDPVSEDGVDAIDERLDAAGLRPALAKALSNLSSGEREVVLLYAWADLSYPEIARAMEIPVGTVRSRLARARARIRELLARSGQLEGDDAVETLNERG